MQLCVVLFTYTPSLDHPRAGYALKTLRSVLDELEDQDVPCRVHVADDGSPAEFRDRIVTIIGDRYPMVTAVSTSSAERQGYGASYNLATQQVHWDSDVILCLEDDWELVGHGLPFEQYGKILLDEQSGVGCVRLGYIGHTERIDLSIDRRHGEQLLLFSPDSPERHVFAGHPRLESRTWQRSVGPWPEGIDPGSTEFVVAGLPAARRGVAFPLRYVSSNAFAHIGTIQARSDQ